MQKRFVTALRGNCLHSTHDRRLGGEASRSVYNEAALRLGSIIALVKAYWRYRVWRLCGSLFTCCCAEALSRKSSWFLKGKLPVSLERERNAYADHVATSSGRRKL